MWVAAINDGSLERYVDLLAPDIIWVPPGADAIVGRAAVSDWLAPFFETYRYEFALDVEDFRPAGAMAVERGSFLTRLIPRGGGASMEHGGSYLVLWRNDDEWRIDRYVDLT